MNTNVIVVLLLVVGGLASLQFFKGRKLNGMLMIHYIRAFEENLKPKDKNYIYLGGTVGFKAKYDILNRFVRDVELTLTMLARQSILWLPISYLLRGGDRLYIVVNPRFKIKRNVHIIRPFAHRFGAHIENVNNYSREDLSIVGNRFYTLYENKNDLEKLKKLIEETFDPSRVLHVSLNEENNTLYCLIKPEPNQTPKELRKLLDNFPKIFEEWTS